MSEFDDYSQDASKRPQSYDPYTGEPIYQAPVYHAASPQQAQPVTYTAPAPAATARKGGGLKTFLLAFAGAALACVLVIAGANVLLGGKGGTTVNLGADGGTSITVSGEDATLPEVVAGKATPSVCCIYVYTQQPSGYSLWGYGGNSNNSSSELTQSSLGSGVILSSDGYVLTNYHVIEGGSAL